MTTKCPLPSNMKFGLGQGPYDTTVRDKPVMLQAFGLPDGVTVNILLRERDGTDTKPGCYDYCAPAIDPCTGQPAALTAATPMTVLNAGATYKMEIVGGDIEELKRTVGVFCYELAGDVSLLLKKVDGGASPDELKAAIQACIAPLQDDIAANAAAIAAIGPHTVDTISVEQLSLTDDVLTVTPGDGSAPYDLTFTHPAPPDPDPETPDVVVSGPPVYDFVAGTATYPTVNDATGETGTIVSDISGLISFLTSTPHIEIAAGDNVTITGTGTTADPFVISGTFTPTTDTDTRNVCTWSLDPVSGELVKTTQVVNALTGDPVGAATTEVVPSQLTIKLNDGTVAAATPDAPLMTDKTFTGKFIYDFVDSGDGCTPEQLPAGCDRDRGGYVLGPDHDLYEMPAGGGAPILRTVNSDTRVVVLPSSNAVIDDATLAGDVGAGLITAATTSRTVENNGCVPIFYEAYVRVNFKLLNAGPDALVRIELDPGPAHTAGLWAGAPNVPMSTRGIEAGDSASRGGYMEMRSFGEIPVGGSVTFDVVCGYEVVEFANPNGQTALNIDGLLGRIIRFRTHPDSTI